MNIVFSFLATMLDRRTGADGALNFWRPSIALAGLDGLSFGEYHLFWQKQFQPMKEEIVQEIAKISPATKVVAEPLEFTDPWNFEEVYSKLYDYASACNFDTEKNNYYIHISTGTHVIQISLFLLGESRLLPGKLLQTQPGEKSGASARYHVIDLDLARYDLIAKRFSVKRDDDLAFLRSGISTRNRAFNTLIETIERVVVRSDEPILLTGPTGAGKSQLAKRIYELKKINRQIAGKFVDVNCATLRGDQAMSALFGHRKGAFTGAVSDRPGLLKSADGGILFLDEIGELGTDEQAMLLRAIEEKVFLPLGGDREEKSSFQLICGTNRNLRRDVREGRFREDLLARINLWDFRLPGLAERREDIEPNIAYELEKFHARTGRHITFNREAHDLFLDYALAPSTMWRGNFRDLNAMLTRLATLAPGGRIDVPTVKNEIEHLRRAEAEDSDGGSGGLTETFAPPEKLKSCDPFDLVQLEYVIKVCRESRNISEAGRKLFSVSRKLRKTPNDTDRLTKYLAKFQLDFDTVTQNNAPL